MSAWKLSYDEWNPDEQPLREALCTVGNGVFCTRGAFEWEQARGVHYPGTYIGCAYDRATTEIEGRDVENEDLVNWPNWLPLSFKPGDGAWLRLEDVEILAFEQSLDARRGVLERTMRIRDGDGRTTRLESRRLAHMHRPHIALLEWTLMPEDWSGPIAIRSAIDGSVENTGVERYSDLESHHQEVVDRGALDEQGVYLVSRAVQSRIEVAMAARTRIITQADQSIDRRPIIEEKRAEEEFTLNARQGEAIHVEKTLALCTSRDKAISEPLHDAKELALRVPDGETLRHEHEAAWDRLWGRCDLRLDCEPEAQLRLRVHIFHLLQTVSPLTTDRDVGVPSRGWHGEAYRGHIFWDELFIFPFLNLRVPEITRALLLYRFRRLDEARHAARREGLQGAMFPWQSGSNGREESQKLHLNPQSGRWIPDNTHRQRHVNAAIAYNIWLYWQTTGDIEFLAHYGAEMILEIARFWSSLARRNPADGRYDIENVVGPDEYHTGYPDDGEGLRNNAYTNVMAVWCLRCARRTLDALTELRRDELRGELGITDDDIERWNDITRGLRLIVDDNGVISQFEGWMDLEELDWERLREKHGDISRLDRVLEAENDTPNRYKVCKQADVLMLFYLFSTEELEDLITRMGYEFSPEWIPANIEHYLARTSHGSTLSRVVHSWVLARSDRGASWELFLQALESDIDDIQGGTTPEGIHLGAMAGTVDIVQRCFTGLETRDDVLWLNPLLPAPVPCLSLRIRHRGHWLDLEVTHERLTIRSARGWSPETKIGFKGEIFTIRRGDSMSFDLD